MAGPHDSVPTKDGTREEDGREDEDPFDSLLSLEQSYYQSGYEEGYIDGQRQARIEARLFGVQTAFKKFETVGRMRARAEIWAARRCMGSTLGTTDSDDLPPHSQDNQGSFGIGSNNLEQGLPPISRNIRLERHVETMLSLLDSTQLPLNNSDTSVAEVDVRLRRAQAKEKIIEKMIGDETASAELLEVEVTSEQYRQSSFNQDRDAGNFEDFGRASIKP